MIPTAYARTCYALPITLLLALIVVAAGGCRQPEMNPTPTTSEADSLADPIQLTHSFTRAGEAYFAPDMKWIIFQASTKPDEDYLMYLAQTKWDGDRIV